MPEQPSSLVELTIDGPVARLTLRRPEARNALNQELLDAALAHVRRLTSLAAGPGRPIVLVLAGEGKALCAGMDLRAVLDDPQRAHALLARLAQLAVALRALPLVTIARIHGAAIGGGCGLTCVCDLSITHDDAKVGFPEVDLGVCPAVVAPWLVRKAGAGVARAVLLRGGLLSGVEAAGLGIVNESVPDVGALDARIESLAASIALGGPDALAATKGLLNELDGSLDEGLAMRCAQLSAQVLATEDAQRRLRARMDKPAPDAARAGETPRRA